MSTLDNNLLKAHHFFVQQKWVQALKYYQDNHIQLSKEHIDDLGNELKFSQKISEVKYHLAYCLFKLGRYIEALNYATESSKLNNNNWKAQHLVAINLRMTGRLPDALKLLSLLHKQNPTITEIRYDFADYVCKVLGDWSLAKNILLPIKHQRDVEQKLNWFNLKQQIYSGTTNTNDFTQELINFSQKFLSIPLLPEKKIPELTIENIVEEYPAKSLNTRPKIALLSTFFRASPVYYLCFSALKNLANDMDLIFYSREATQDWATDKFKSIAYDWHDCMHYGLEELSSLLKSEKLDIIIDLCGWLDQDVLKVLSTRPAKKLYKWVGGQSTTTGLSCFDGYLTDRHQSPRHLQQLYSEPLLFLDSGYATYTAPNYLPPPKKFTNSGRWQVGIISHPMKVSGGFLAFLIQHIQALENNRDFLINLRFIGWRYRLPALQQRILQVFKPVFDKACQWLSIEFVFSSGHEDFLNKVSQLDWIIDTFPYTSGVTALESLALGVPCRTRKGQLFSQRHAYSHCRYADIDTKDFDLDKLGPFTPPQQPKSGVTLLAKNCDRKNHEALATSLAKVLL